LRRTSRAKSRHAPWDPLRWSKSDRVFVCFYKSHGPRVDENALRKIRTFSSRSGDFDNRFVFISVDNYNNNNNNDHNAYPTEFHGFSRTTIAHANNNNNNNLAEAPRRRRTLYHTRPEKYFSRSKATAATIVPVRGNCARARVL